MARTRAQRRRHTVAWTIALAVTLIVLVFARDVSRAGHGAAGPQSSENQSFAALANALTTSENQFDSNLNVLLTQGTTLSRKVFAADLYQLNDVLTSWTTTADQLRRPELVHHINDELNQLTNERVSAYQTLFFDIARALALPWSNVPSNTTTSPATTLSTTTQQWNSDRKVLASEPGRARLDALTSLSATTYAANGVTPLRASPSLTLVRTIGIAALRVSPSPLPASLGILLLPPVTSVELEISVLNAGYDDQPVALSVFVTPLNGRGSSFKTRVTTTLGPLRAYAFAPMSLTTAPSERARVTIYLTGAPAASGMVTTQRYTLELSPSGNP